MSNHYLTETGLSNVYTMSIAGNKEPKHALPNSYEIPNAETRLLRARLILEEALETIHGLGFNVDVVDYNSNSHHVAMNNVEFVAANEPNLIDIIDGCCDTIYVATGTMLSCGAPDGLHLHVVNKANNRKFPNGEAIIDAHGKFQKPEGWTPPNHALVMENFRFDYNEVFQKIMQEQIALPGVNKE